MSVIPEPSQASEPVPQVSADGGIHPGQRTGARGVR